MINISFIRPHLDYGDAIFDQAYNKSFHESLESLQYNASLAITRAIRGTSKQKLYQDLGLESPQHRRWFLKPAFSTRFLKMNLEFTFMRNYLFKPPLITKDRLEICPFFLLNTISS